MRNEIYGSTLERGVIEKIENGKYRVSSLTRDGITSIPIKSTNEKDTYSIGDMVYFFLFDDGDGLILSRM